MRTIFIIALMAAHAYAAEINGVKIPDNELRAIWSAVRRNVPDEKYHPVFVKLLIAIRKAENGGPGREFGILNRNADTIDKQSGECAYICWVHYRMWKKQPDATNDFILYLRDFYAPVSAHKLNKHWYGNVTAVLKKLNGGK